MLEYDSLETLEEEEEEAMAYSYDVNNTAV
jgi:hypothetical protein